MELPFFDRRWRSASGTPWRPRDTVLAASACPSRDRGDAAVALAAFYSVYAPHRVAAVSLLLRQYTGPHLHRRLSAKYNDAPAVLLRVGAGTATPRARAASSPEREAKLLAALRARKVRARR